MVIKAFTESVRLNSTFALWRGFVLRRQFCGYSKFGAPNEHFC